MIIYADNSTDKYTPIIDDIVDSVGKIFKENGNRTLVLIKKIVEVEISVNIVNKEVDAKEFCNYRRRLNMI